MNEHLEASFQQLSETFLTRISDERKRSDENQLAAINRALREWSTQIQHSTVSAAPELLTSGSVNEHELIRGALADAKERQGKIIDEMKEAHRQQLDILRAVISEERREALQAQHVYEETLRTKYESMVQALQEKVKAEQDSRMRRALEDLERNARLESERARQMFEAQQSAELAVSNKFKHLVGDLRKSWEEEEASRAKQLEERLRSHYTAVLEHMESQLQMALKLQDEADRQWMEDVEARNKQQVTTMRSFEEKCRRLYDTRLSEYVERTDQQLSEYEDQLLQVGGNLAVERARFESKLRRLKLSCARWKGDYQKEIQKRYNDMVAVLESRYMGEVETLLSELADSREQLMAAEHAVQLKEQELFEERRAADGLERRITDTEKDKKAGRASLASQRDSLLKLWQGLGTPVEEKIQVLVSLLDCADYTPELSRRYETIQKRLSARLPIVQMLTRRQYIEYKLKYIQKFAVSDSPGAEMSRADALTSKSTLLTELSELQGSIENAIRDYEQQFGERFVKPTTTPLNAAATPEHPSPQHALSSNRPARAPPTPHHDLAGGMTPNR